MAEEILLTQAGYDKIVAELEELVSVRRKEVSERLKEAISYGDLSENAEYDSAKDEQAELEERIVKLENMIRTAKIIDENQMTNDFVGVGLKVKIKDMDSGEDMEFTIVGSTEADPLRRLVYRTECCTIKWLIFQDKRVLSNLIREEK